MQITTYLTLTLVLSIIFDCAARAEERQLRYELGGIHNGSGYIPNSGTVARPPAPSKICVCEYQREPQRCFRHRSESACTAEREDNDPERDCIWVGGGSTGVCKNWHQQYCETEFAQRPPTEGCRRQVVIPAGEPLPVCTAEDGEMFYTYHGHGPRIQQFLNSVKSIIRSSHRSCSFGFKDQSCQTFAVAGNRQINGFPDVRTAIDNEVRPLLQRSQRATLTANQLNAEDTIRPPYTAHNPYYSFTFDRTRIIQEDATPCGVGITCGPRQEGNFYMCNTGAGIQNRRCCSGRWRENVIRCP